MNRLSLSRIDHHAMSRLKRQSALTVDTIPEADETQAETGASTPDAPALPPLPFMIPTSAGADESLEKALLTEKTPRDVNSRLAEKQKSGSSILKREPGLWLMSRSDEALIAPPRSPASSVAATLNDDPGELDLQSVDSETDHIHNEEMVSDNTSGHEVSRVGDQRPSPAALSVKFDPEGLGRPQKAGSDGSPKIDSGSSIMARGRGDTSGNAQSRGNQSQSAASTVNVKGKTPLPAEASPPKPLTEEALVHVPSQVSNVVMTYRTNEWAKHISTAEIPIVDQDNTPPGDGIAESPAQLEEAPAPVRIEEPAQTAASNTQAATNASALPSTAELPIRSSKRDSSKDDAPDLHRSLSDRSLAATPAIVVRPPTAVGGQSASRPSRASRPNSSVLRNQIPPTTIDENVETRFPSKSLPLSPSPECSTPSKSPPPTGPVETAPAGQDQLRSASYPRLPMLTPSDHLYQQAVASTSDTRLSSSIDSRQPARRASTFEPRKRDSLLADWQGALRRENSMTAIPKAALEQRRAEMVLERRKSNQSQQRDQVSRQFREKEVERAMRTSDMQALHLKAMRKIQARANRHV
jgi:hypothetical protein